MMGMGSGRAALGKIQALETVSIGDVAGVAVEMLSRDDVSGWFDLVEGENAIAEAVKRVVMQAMGCLRGDIETQAAILDSWHELGRFHSSCE
jgi:hypothetical protein